MRYLYIHILLATCYLLPAACAAQIITTVAGNGTAGYSGDGGQATNAELNNPDGVAFDAIGNIYIADQGNNRIRKVNTAGIITTIAGNGTQGFSGDGGTATNASLYAPSEVVIDAGGNLYFTDENNNRVRMVNTAGIITTIAGNGTAGYNGDGGQATFAELHDPVGLTFDVKGNLYIVDDANNKIRKINTLGIISVFAGNGTQGFSGDGGQATNAELNLPADIAFDAIGDLYITDQINNRIRKIDTLGIISTIAGNGTTGYSGDGGQATHAELSNPAGICLDAIGNLYIADSFNDRIRKVNTLGIITTLAGIGATGYSGDGGQATAAELNRPARVTIDFADNLFITDYDNNRVRMVTNIEQMGLQQYIGINCQVTVYPNPVSNSLQVLLSDNMATQQISITDMLGNTVKQVSVGSNQVSINISDLNAGLYLLRIETIEGITIKKIIKN